MQRLHVSVLLSECILTTITNLSRALSSCSQFQLVTWCALLLRVRSLSLCLALSHRALLQFPLCRRSFIASPFRTSPSRSATPAVALPLTVHPLSLSRVCSLICALSRCRHSLRPLRCPVHTNLSSASCHLACAQPMSCAIRAACYVSFFAVAFVVFVLLCVRVNCFCCSYCKHTQTSYTPPLDHTHTHVHSDATVIF